MSGEGSLPLFGPQFPTPAHRDSQGTEPATHLPPELVAREGQDPQTTLSISGVQVDKLSVVYVGFASLRGHVGDDAHEAPGGGMGQSGEVRTADLPPVAHHHQAGRYPPVLVQVNHAPVDVLGGELVHRPSTAPVFAGRALQGKGTLSGWRTSGILIWPAVPRAGGIPGGSLPKKTGPWGRENRLLLKGARTLRSGVHLTGDTEAPGGGLGTPRNVPAGAGRRRRVWGSCAHRVLVLDRAAIVQGCGLCLPPALGARLLPPETNPPAPGSRRFSLPGR